MSRKSYLPRAALAAAAAAALLSPLAALADWRGDHPHYMHALADLQQARWNIMQREGDRQVTHDESVAVDEIDRAIGEARRAASMDGKDIDDQVQPDTLADVHGRLRTAQALLQQAQSDVDRDESNPDAVGLRDRVSHHIAIALDATSRAIADRDRYR